MPEPLNVAVIGLGRMGMIHALHLHELARDTGTCKVAALVDEIPGRAQAVADQLGCPAPTFESIGEFLDAGVCSATILVTPTSSHRAHATQLIRAGHRLLIEKPLTGTLEGDREFAAELDRDHPQAVMIAFQRRFDEPLRYAKELIDRGTIGRVFKIFSALEDSNPAPDGYRSGGILADMSIHNVDEVLWIAGKMPSRALAIGSNLHGHALTTSEEDFDDAALFLWFDRMLAQVQVSRNHVSGYRVESIYFGERGQIHIGHFDQRLFDITVEAYGRRGQEVPLAHKVFPMRRYGQPLAEFIDRFGPAYKAEVAAFVDCCRNRLPFPATHNDCLRAQEVISAGMQAIVSPEQAASVASPR